MNAMAMSGSWRMRRAFSGQSAQTLTAGLLQKVRAFAGGGAAVRRHRDPGNDGRQPWGKRFAEETLSMNLQLHATPQEVMRAVEALQDFGRDRQIGEKEIFGLSLALEECGSNIVNHALQRDARQQFQVAIEHTGSAVSIELRDRGPEFDPTDLRAVQPRPDDDGLPGGWGIQLARRYMDEIRYRRENDENILLLIKRLLPHSGQK